MTKNILALDIGTQSARAAIVSENGEILGIEQILHEVDSPNPGWAQQRADSWWDEICQAIQRVFKATNSKTESIVAVSSCGQMHGPVGIDEQGCVTTDWVQLWCDKRCQTECEQVRQAHDEAKLASIAANPINPAWMGLKICWYRENLPEEYQRTRWFLAPKDFINFKLTGVAATDPSEASGTFLWDHQKDNYSEELARALDVDLERFAPVRPSHSMIGGVTEEASKQTDIRAGTPVVTGGGDFPVSMLGLGIVGEGSAADVTGTSTLLAMHSARPLIHPSVQNLRHVVDGWIPFTILDCGGISMKWCKDLVSSIRGSEVSYDSLIEMAAKVPMGSDGLFFYPYMLGERRHENTDARGGFFGMTLNHGIGHIARAVMEGVALAIGRDIVLFQHMDIDVNHILCAGGGVRNNLWNQIKADVIQRPLELSEEPEAGLKGAALLGAAGVGLVDDLCEESRRRRGRGKVILPHDDSDKWSRNAMNQFSSIYDHMLGFWKSNALFEE